MTSQFPQGFNAEIDALADRLGETHHNAFCIWFAINVLEITETEAISAISIEGGNDKGIDLFHVDDDEGRIIICQIKYSKSQNPNLKERHVDALTSSLDWLANPVDLEKEGKFELADAAREYMEAIQSGFATELWFVYNGKISNNIEKKITVYNKNPSNRDSNRVIRHYHLETIKGLWLEYSGKVSRITEVNLDFVGNLSFDAKRNFGRYITCTIPAQQLQDLHKKYGDQLFDRNVRLYLGARKGSVNAGILETLEDSTEKLNFWAYNNGITVICDKFSIDNKKSKLKIENMSIINGCQTTVSLSQHEDLKDVEVLCRVISASDPVIDRIIQYNNSQNPIKIWDIASQDKTQKRLKAEFEGLKTPYIYLTRRGSRPRGDLKKYRDRSTNKLRQINIDLAGQYSAAFRGRPVLAYKNKGLIFSKYKDDVFPPDVRVEEVLLHIIVGEISREEVTNSIRDGESEVVRILKKGGSLFVLSLVSSVLDWRNGVNYIANISEGQITSKAAQDRFRKYVLYCILKYTTAVDDILQIEKVELTTLVKSPELFEKVRSRVKRAFDQDALGKKWLNEALPKVGNK